MKSAHRHELETNVLAHRLEAYIDRYRPYATTVAGVLLAIVVAILIWTYMSGSSAARRNEAWDSYNQALNTNPPKLEELRRTAEDNPGTSIEQLANITWADAQVYAASNTYVYNRAAANQAMSQAISRYQAVIQSSDDERLLGRAHLGLARIYEMQNELDNAIKEYKQVTGPYATYAKQQAERLARPDAKETYTWLATAQPPRPKAPMGPGTPGQRPEFAPGDIGMPGATDSKPNAPEATQGGDPFQNLLKSMELESKGGDTADRYQKDQKDQKNQPPSENGKDAATAAPETGAAAKGDNSPAESAPPKQEPATSSDAAPKK
jgi:predicted negative regulator of RcsB-dependent stress response